MKILIISPFFPPDKTIASLRMSSLSNYLLNKGHQIGILTNKKKEISSELQKYSVFYTDISQDSSSFSKKKFQFTKNQKEYTNKFIDVIEMFHPDIIIISGGPFYTFKLAKVANTYKIPTILDFRDPWIFDYRGIYDSLSPIKTLYRLRHLHDERTAIEKAAVVVMVTQGWSELYKKIYPKSMDKFYVIENGYDEVELSDLPHNDNQPNEIFTIGVFGKFAYYSQKYTRHLLFCLSKMSSEQINILQIGNQEEILEKLMIKEKIDKRIFSSTGFIDYKEGMSKLNQMDALLIVDNRIDALGTKIYDYIYVNKPIIYIGPKKSQIAKLLGNFQNGFVCETKNEISEAINFLMKEKPDFLDHNIDITQYSRKKQNAKYEDLIIKVLKNY